MKQKIIILEGIDMTGKTNICHALNLETGIPVVKIKRNERWFDPAIDIMYGGETFIQIAEQTGYSFIFDRHHPSEYVYSEIYKRPSPTKKVFDIDERYGKLGATIVFCYKQESAYLEDDQKLIEKSKYFELQEKFKEFMSLSKCKILFLDTTDEDLESQIKKIKNFVEL